MRRCTASQRFHFPRNLAEESRLLFIAMKNHPTLLFSFIGLAIGTLAPAQDSPARSEAPPPARREEVRRPESDRPQAEPRRDAEPRREAARPAEDRKPEPRGERPPAPPAEGRRPEPPRPEDHRPPQAVREHHERMKRELHELRERLDHLQRELGHPPAGHRPHHAEAATQEREQDLRAQHAQRQHHIREAVENLKAAGLERAAQMVEKMAHYPPHHGKFHPRHGMHERGHQRRPGPGSPPPMNPPQPKPDQKS